MSTPVAALCQFLVEDVFGELAAQTFETLAVHGRLSLHALVQHSRLTPRQTKHALAILVQHNFVVWSLESGHNTSYEVHIRNTYNLVRHGRLLRVIDDRYGQVGRSIISVLLQTGHGHLSGIVSAILEEIARREGEEEEGANAEAQGEEEARENGSGAHHSDVPATNGTHKRLDDLMKERLTNEVRIMALVLIKDGFLTLVHESHFHPTADNQAHSRSIQLKIHDRKVKKAEEATFNREIKSRVVDWQYNSSARQELLDKAASLNAKVARKHRGREPVENGDNRPTKKVRLDYDTTTKDSVKVSWNPLRTKDLGFLDTVNVRINFDKLSVVARNEKLIHVADSEITRATSLVYEQLLDGLGQSLAFCRESIDSRLQIEEDDEGAIIRSEDTSTVLTRDIVTGVDFRNVHTGFGRPFEKRSKKISRTRAPDDDDAMDISGNEDDFIVPVAGKHEAGTARMGGQTATKKRKKASIKPEANGVGSDDGGDDDDDNDNDGWNNVRNDPSVVKQHLSMLEKYRPQLACKHAPTPLRYECWSVDFKEKAHDLRLKTIDEIIQSRFDRPALRLVRIMREKGKLEPKHLAEFSLMNHKKQLSYLTALHTNGYVELQEVPKDSTRAPGKTVFLWFFDERRCAIRMLEDSYKAMTRCLQRIRLEGEKYRNVIQKSQRSDVEGNEEDMLTDHERSQLEKWRGIEDKLMVQVGRIDEVVYCLRDF